MRQLWKKLFQNTIYPQTLKTSEEAKEINYDPTILTFLDVHHYYFNDPKAPDHIRKEKIETFKIIKNFVDYFKKTGVKINEIARIDKIPGYEHENDEPLGFVLKTESGDFYVRLSLSFPMYSFDETERNVGDSNREAQNNFYMLDYLNRNLSKDVGKKEVVIPIKGVKYSVSELRWKERMSDLVGYLIKERFQDHVYPTKEERERFYNEKSQYNAERLERFMDACKYNLQVAPKFKLMMEDYSRLKEDSQKFLLPDWLFERVQESNGVPRVMRTDLVLFTMPWMFRENDAQTLSLEEGEECRKEDDRTLLSPVEREFWQGYIKDKEQDSLRGSTLSFLRQRVVEPEEESVSSAASRATSRQSSRLEEPVTAGLEEGAATSKLTPVESVEDDAWPMQQTSQQKRPNSAPGRFKLR